MIMSFQFFIIILLPTQNDYSRMLIINLLSMKQTTLAFKVELTLYILKQFWLK